MSPASHRPAGLEGAGVHRPGSHRLPQRTPDYCQICNRLAQAEDLLAAGEKEQASYQLALVQAGALALMTETLLIAAGSLLEIEKKIANLAAVQSAPRVLPAAWPRE